MRRPAARKGEEGDARFAWPVLVVAGLMAIGLMSVSGAYGFHGDEMYYAVAGQHPAFGDVDRVPPRSLPRLSPHRLLRTVATTQVTSPMAPRTLCRHDGQG